MAYFFKFFRRAAYGAGAAALGAAIVGTGASAQDIDFANYEPSVRAVKIERDAAPDIDGDLSDAAWSFAGRIEQFYQVEPTQGGQPSEPTIAYLMYDERNLYIGVRAFDSEPDRITATVQGRDGEVWKDDTIKILLDPFNTRRDSFFFQVNALGARLEMLTENNSDARTSWDIIWEADAQIDEEGWSLEVKIPFQSISFDPNADDWGFQIVREIKRKNEVIRWANIDQSFGDINIQRPGRLAGIDDADQGVGLDVQAFANAAWRRRWQEPGREDDFTVEPSGNIYYKLTPSMTGTLTFNTDFSDAPLDTRQVNTSRFALFFPEVRDFFLQDAAIFAFGGRNFTAQGPNKVNGTPFFSRRIGILPGEPPVDITAGAKLSGSVGRFNIGALTTRMNETAVVDAQQLSVVRVSAEVGAESRVGAVFTNGDPTGETNNTVAGLDYQYRNSDFLGGQTLNIDAFALKSFSNETSDEGESFGVDIAMPNDRHFGFFTFKQIDETYDPKLGFTNRPDTRLYSGVYRRRWRPQESYLRFYQMGMFTHYFTDLNDTPQSRNSGAWFTLVNQIGDELEFNYSNEFENIIAPFQLPDGVVVPVGRYTYNRGSVDISSSDARPVELSASVECCEWFDGDRLDISTSLNLRLSRFLALNWSHDINDIRLPTGDVTIHISSINADANFTPNLQFASQIQYDNISESLSYFGRLRWEIRPETELFISLSHQAFTDFDRFQSIESGSVIRVGNTFRF